MLTWQHTCITLNLNDGSSIMYENGKLVAEKKFDVFVAFGKVYPGFLASEISVGCVTYWEVSHVGIVTDFQLFSRILSKQEMERWTGCQEPGETTRRYC